MSNRGRAHPHTSLSKLLFKCAKQEPEVGKSLSSIGNRNVNRLEKTKRRVALGRVTTAIMLPSNFRASAFPPGQNNSPNAVFGKNRLKRWVHWQKATAKTCTNFGDMNCLSFKRFSVNGSLPLVCPSPRYHLEVPPSLLMDLQRNLPTTNSLTFVGYAPK